MIYKAKESAASDNASRKKEDEKIVEIFLSSIEMEDKQIVKTIRLGRKTDEDINRPLLVSFNTEQDVIEINRKLPKLKEATAEIKNLRISPDRSLIEREEVRNLVTKAKNLNDPEEGNYVYLVRGTQILKVKEKARHSDHVLIELELLAHRKISQTLIRYIFAKGDYDQMSDEVKNLSVLHSEDNVEKLWTDLRELLTELTKSLYH